MAEVAFYHLSGCVSTISLLKEMLAKSNKLHCQSSLSPTLWIENCLGQTKLVEHERQSFDHCDLLCHIFCVKTTIELIHSTCPASVSLLQNYGKVTSESSFWWSRFIPFIIVFPFSLNSVARSDLRVSLIFNPQIIHIQGHNCQAYREVETFNICQPTSSITDVTALHKFHLQILDGRCTPRKSQDQRPEHFRHGKCIQINASSHPRPSTDWLSAPKMSLHASKASFPIAVWSIQWRKNDDTEMMRNK